MSTITFTAADDPALAGMRKFGDEVFVYDNPEYQGCVGAVAGGWFAQRYDGGDGPLLWVRVRRREGLSDPNFRVPRMLGCRYADAPPAVFTGTCPPPPEKGYILEGQDRR